MLVQRWKDNIKADKAPKKLQDVSCGGKVDGVREGGRQMFAKALNPGSPTEPQAQEAAREVEWALWQYTEFYLPSYRPRARGMHVCLRVPAKPPPNSEAQ